MNVDTDFILNQVCPIVGVVLSTCQLSSSIKVILQARRDQDLGVINPYPLVVSLVCCISWFLYGLLLGNVYYVLSVIIGTLVNILSYTTAMNLLGLHNRQVAAGHIEKFLLVCISWYLLVGLLSSFDLISSHRVLVMVGYSALTSSLIYYLAPLSSLLEIIKTRNSSSLYYPSVILNMIASGMWFAYGVSLGDLNLTIPMAYGLGLSIIQLGVKMRYGAGCCKTRKTNAVEDSGMKRTDSSDDAPSGGFRRKNADSISKGGADGWVADEQIVTAPATPPEGQELYYDGKSGSADSGADIEPNSPILVAGGGDMHTLSITTTPWSVEAPHDGMTSMSMASPKQMVSDSVSQDHESFAEVLVDALAGVLAPMRTQISMRTIESIEEHGHHPHAPVISDQPVTIVGAVSEMIGNWLPSMGSIAEEAVDEENPSQRPSTLPFSLEMPSIRVTRNESGSGYIQLDSFRTESTKDEVDTAREQSPPLTTAAERYLHDNQDDFV